MTAPHKTYTFRVTGYLAGGKVAPEFVRHWLRSGRGASERAARAKVKYEFTEQFPEYKLLTHVMPAED